MMDLIQNLKEGISNIENEIKREKGRNLMKDCQFKNFEWLVKLLKKENESQLRKWGIQNHSPFEWLAYTIEELGELSGAISEKEYRNGGNGDVIKEAVQVATLALKIAEMYYKKEMGT